MLRDTGLTNKPFGSGYAKKNCLQYGLATSTVFQNLSLLNLRMTAGQCAGNGASAMEAKKEKPKYEPTKPDAIYDEWLQHMLFNFLLTPEEIDRDPDLKEAAKEYMTA